MSLCRAASVSSQLVECRDSLVTGDADLSGNYGTPNSCSTGSIPDLPPLLSMKKMERRQKKRMKKGGDGGKVRGNRDNGQLIKGEGRAEE